MRICRIVLSLLCSAAIISTAFHVTWAQAPPPQPSLPAPGEDDVEVYTRGILHEAFATPVTNDVVIPPVVQKEPPAAIEELPPEQQPEGDNVTWIGGYWAWDEELDDYIWISGLWRDVPPGQQWIPGYWAQTSDGYQWVAGMWTEVGSQTIAYLPTPPDSLEHGPQIQAPSADYFYVPGCWEFHDGRYAWRTGYWAPRQREWIWVPAHYVYTPYGCCFVPGRWDLLLVDRGLCYAPVRFHHHRPAYVYRPVIVIDTWDTMVMHLWVDPRRGCYAYGNYYDAPHSHFVPWYEYRGRGGHDHLFAYYEWRNGPEYRQRLSGWHDHFVEHRDWRPPATYREHVQFVESRRSTTNINLSLAIDVRKIDRDRDRDVRLPVNLKQVSRDDESRFREQAKSWVAAAQTRRQLETQKVGRPPEAAKPDRNGRPVEPKRVTLELPKAVAVAKKEGPKLETPDKLKNVKPDKPTGDAIRVPSRTKEQRIAQEQTLKRDRPDPKRTDLATPTDVPPPPTSRNKGEQASKDDQDRKKPDVRDAFGIDTPGRGRDNMPNRPGRVQTDPQKPGADTKDNNAPSRTPRPSIGKPGDDAKKPEPRRNDLPRIDTGKPNMEKPDRTPNRNPKSDPPPKKPEGATPDRKAGSPEPRDRGRSDELKMEADKNTPRVKAPDPAPRRTETTSPKTPSTDRKSDPPPRAGNPPKSSTTEPRRNDRPTITLPKTGDPKSDSSKSTPPERKGPPPKPDSKDKKDKDDEKKEKDKKPS